MLLRVLPGERRERRKEEERRGVERDRDWEREERRKRMKLVV